VSPAGELATYAHHLRWVLDEIGVTVRGLDPAELHWRPASREANSAAAIVRHVVGSTRVYALGFGCRLAVDRDRSAEFAADGDDVARLVADVQALARDVDAALGTLPPEALDERLTPARHLWGTGEPRELSRRDALVESVRHAALHLGELRLTRDLARIHAAIARTAAR
jgi:DinB family protein